MKTGPTVEGYWFSDDTPEFPMPRALKKPWVGRRVFLDALSKKETKTPQRYFKGWSTCRICRCGNGSSEFHTNQFVWPEGLRHYVEAHNVKPSLSFREFVIGRKNGGN